MEPCGNAFPETRPAGSVFICRFEKRERFFLPVNKGLAGSDELIPVIHHPDS